MFTGLLPRDHGVRINGQSLRPDLPTIPQTFADAGYRTHAAGKLHLTSWMPQVTPPRPECFPECLDYWNSKQIREFPAPYYGFESVDFVGGHTSFIFGPYLEWLKDQGGDPDLLNPQHSLRPLSSAPSCYQMAMPPELHYNRYIADSTIGVIQESADPATRPFFAWCSFPDPHYPVAPPAPYGDLYSPADIPLPPQRQGELEDLPTIYRQILDGSFCPNGIQNADVNPEHWKEIIALTYGMITHLDAEVGRVLNALDQAGQTENTVILFLSDHGDMMGDHGLLWKGPYTFQGCTRIPTIVSAPGQPGGRFGEALISQIDLFPSLADLCDIPLPGSDWAETPTPFSRGALRPMHPYPGLSWKGLLDGATGAIRSSVVIENDEPTSGYRARSLVTDSHRLTIYPGSGEGELFDLHQDPGEQFNLWFKPDNAPLRGELLTELLMAYSEATPWFPIPPWNS